MRISRQPRAWFAQAAAGWEISGIAGLGISHPRLFLGLALSVAGVLLLAAVGGYLVYGWLAKEDLESLAYAPDTTSSKERPATGKTLESLPGLEPASAAKERSPESFRLYPGERLAFDSWADPWSAQPPSTEDQELLEEYLSAGPFGLGRVGELPPATRIAIPAIELQADVQDLRILDLGDSRQYETPNRVVGHIPGTANPGEAGNNWLFGHLQSPLRNEGAVFSDLPRIPEMLRRGEQVYIILDAPGASYLYEIYKTEVMYQDDLRLYDTEEATVTLVTCVPPLVYDYRLLVMGKLVGFKPTA